MSGYSSYRLKSIGAITTAQKWITYATCVHSLYVSLKGDEKVGIHVEENLPLLLKQKTDWIFVLADCRNGWMRLFLSLTHTHTHHTHWLIHSQNSHLNWLKDCIMWLPKEGMKWLTVGMTQELVVSLNDSMNEWVHECHEKVSWHGV
jgi:hypothetical protein